MPDGANRHDVNLQEGTLQTIVTAHPEGMHVCLDAVRYEKKARNYQALVAFTCALIVWRNLIPIHPGLIPG